MRVIEGDCVEAMAAMPEASVDAIVTDPPYGLEFMGREWDSLTSKGRGAKVRERRAGEVTPVGGGHVGSKGPYLAAGVDYQGVNQSEMQEWHEAWAREALRVLKPGGHLLAFGGTRTSHRLACAIEDAGFEIRDSLIWLYGSGFPKSLDVSKAIDKRPGVSRHGEFAAHLRERMAAKGYTNTFDVAEVVIGRRTGAVANWQKYQWPEAKWWPALKALLDLDESWGDVIAEAEREKTGEREVGRLAVAPGQGEDRSATSIDLTTAATPDAERWQGWGTALKPAHEPIVVARKPLAGTVAANVLAHGTGALNVDGCRIAGTDEIHAPQSDPSKREGVVGTDLGISGAALDDFQAAQRASVERANTMGRWPANVALSHSEGCVCVGERRVRTGMAGPNSTAQGFRAEHVGGDADSGGSFPGGFADGDGLETVEAWECVAGCPVAELDRQSGPQMHGAGVARGAVREADATGMWAMPGDGQRYGDSGGASRFFYTAKASRAERNAGLAGFEARDATERHAMSGLPDQRMDREQERRPAANSHPTVKPIDLMRWLVRLVTPPGGTVLDPFLGSGTTGCAATLEGFDFIGIEREADYVKIAEARIAFWQEHPEGLTLAQATQAEVKRGKTADAGQASIFDLID